MVAISLTRFGGVGRIGSLGSGSLRRDIMFDLLLTGSGARGGGAEEVDGCD